MSERNMPTDVARTLAVLSWMKSWFQFAPPETRRAQYRAENSQHAQNYWLICALSFLAAHIDHSILISAYWKLISKLRALGSLAAHLSIRFHTLLLLRGKKWCCEFSMACSQLESSGSPELLLEWQQGPANAPMIQSTTGQFLLWMLLAETKSALTHSLLTFPRATAARELC